MMGTARDFLRWWWAGLHDCIPPALRRLGRPRGRRLLVRVTAQHTVVGVQRNGRGDDSRSFAADAGGQRRLGQYLYQQRRAGAEIVLAAEDARVLTRDVVFPAAAEENLYQVVGFEMDRLTPYRMADTLYAAHIVERLAEDEKLRVRLLLVPRAQVQAELARLAELGISPDAIRIRHAGGALSIPLPRDEDDAAEVTSVRRRWNLALGTLCAGLLVAAVAIPVVRDASRVAALEQEEAEARLSAMAAVAIRDQIQEFQQRRGELLQLTQGPAAIGVLNELSEVLPEHTWLFRLGIGGGVLTIQGESESSTELIQVLESADGFEDVSFSAPVQQNPRSGRERFSLTATIIGQRP